MTLGVFFRKSMNNRRQGLGLWRHKSPSYFFIPDLAASSQPLFLPLLSFVSGKSVSNLPPKFFGKLTDGTYACNGLTNFKFKG
jgi:hypothetical protein